MRKINEKTIDSYLDMWGLKRKTPYINNRTKFEIGCPNGHSFFITYNNLLKRKKVECKECENLKKYTHFKETLEKEGYSVLSSFDECCDKTKSYLFRRTFHRINICTLLRRKKV